MRVFRSLFLKKLDVVLMVVFPVLAVALSLFFKANFLWSTFLFYGLPSLWLSFRTPQKVLKTLLFTVMFSIPLGVIIGHFATADQSWFIDTVFPFQIFGVTPLENPIWAFFLVYFILIFYEHFLDKGKHNLIDRRMKYLVWPIVIIFVLFIIAMLVVPEAVYFPYAYLFTGVFIVAIPTFLFLYKFPRLLQKYAVVTIYFFVLSLMYEFTGLQLNQWSFPGNHFIGWVELFGYRFPFEEFFAWMVLGAVSAISFYEFFDDDRK